MKNSLVISLLILSAIGLKAQQKITWKGVVSDSFNGKPLRGVQIWSDDLSRGTYTKTDGSFEFRFVWEDDASVSFSSIGFETRTIELNDSLKSLVTNQTLKLDLELDFIIYEIPGTEITGAPDTVFGHKDYHVADFAFVEPGSLLLLTYESEKHVRSQNKVGKSIYTGCSLILIDRLKRERHQISLSQDVSELVTDHLDEVFVMGEESVNHVSIQDDKIYITELSHEDFEEYVEPIIDSVGQTVYMCTYNPDYPAFEYYCFNQKDSTYHTLKYMVNSELMELFRSEYKYLAPRQKLEAFRYELSTGIDKEIVAAYMTGFSESMYYEPLYAPLLIPGDSVMIFDHYSDKIYKFDSDNLLSDSVAIDYHKKGRKKKWEKALVLDKEQDQVYALFDRNGFHYVQHIDTKTGHSDSGFKLTHRYAEKLRIRNNWAYYVYRPFESSQKKFLYKESIALEPVE